MSAEDLGLPEGAILERPCPLREWLGEDAVVVRPVTLEHASWGRLRGRRIGLRALSAGNHPRALASAIEWLTEKVRLPREDRYTDSGESAQDLETRIQLLARALVTADAPHARLVKSADDVRDIFTPEQILWLYDRWSEVQAERSPIEHIVDPERVRVIADAMGKGSPSWTSLKSYDAATLRSIVIELASRLSRLTTPPSSDTSSSST